MRKSMIFVVLLAFFLTGCTGSFNLTKKVYNFHRSQSDKWSDELCFLLVALTPIYGLATFGDAIIFNSIEFWTGENPVAYNAGDAKSKMAKNGDDELLMAYNPATEEITLVSKTGDQQNPSIVLERNDHMVLAKNEQGQILFSSVKDENGNVFVYDNKGKLVKNYSAQEVESYQEKLVKN